MVFVHSPVTSLPQHVAFDAAVPSSVSMPVPLPSSVRLTRLAGASADVGFRGTRSNSPPPPPPLRRYAADSGMHHVADSGRHAAGRARCEDFVFLTVPLKIPVYAVSTTTADATGVRAVGAAHGIEPVTATVPTPAAAQR